MLRDICPDLHFLCKSPEPDAFSDLLGAIVHLSALKALFIFSLPSPTLLLLFY